MRNGLACTGLLAAVFCLQGVAVSQHVATLTLPTTTLGRSGTVPIVFSFPVGLTGSGQLKIHWSDSLGRVVEDDVRPVVLTDEIEITFPIDLSRTVAMKNTLTAELSLDTTDAKGTSHVDETASADFVVKPNAGWNDYVIIMYQEYPSALQPAMEQLGINAGQYPGRNFKIPQYLLDNNMRWYCEQIGTDYYAQYHRYRTDRTHDWSLDQDKALYKKDPTSKEAFKRNPSFWDPEWRSKIHDRLVDVAKLNAPYRPVFYSLSDESGIGSLGNQWDYDFSDMSLVPMRRWLRDEYGTLAALNKEWGTNFTSWLHVMPMTTNEAMQRKDDNFASWGDFKNWMDYSYADAITMGVNAVHEIDPDAYVGVLGGQKPGWGGYDYDRMTKVASVIELYDIGNNVKLAHSLNPSLPLLKTAFAGDNWAKWEVWHELIQGERGLILWDENQDYIKADGSKGKAGTNAEGYYNELRGGLGALLINSTSLDDKIAIHYSQASMRTEWLLERRPDGDAWMTRGAEYERAHNIFLRDRLSWGHAIEDQGLEYSFVSYSQLAEGALQNRGYHVLILPHSSSLSQKEVENIRDFIFSGGVVVADQLPGTFDEHSRRLTASPLADLFGGDHSKPLTIVPYGKGKAVFVSVNILDYVQDRVVSKEEATYNVIADLFKTSETHPEIAVTDDQGKPVVGVDVHSYTNGGVRLLALETSPEMAVDALGPADFRSNKRFESAKAVHVNLPSKMYVYDVRQKKSLGQQSSLTFTVDPYEPTILTLTSVQQPHLQVTIPEQAAAGTIVPVVLKLPGTSSATQIYHVEVIDPSGKRSIAYTKNVIATGGAAVDEIPLAKNDPVGQWTIHVEDLLTGNVETRTLNVH